jgi:hypothetical protein
MDARSGAGDTVCAHRGPTNTKPQSLEAGTKPHYVCHRKRYSGDDDNALLQRLRRARVRAVFGRRFVGVSCTHFRAGFCFQHLGTTGGRNGVHHPKAAIVVMTNDDDRKQQRRLQRSGSSSFGGVVVVHNGPAGRSPFRNKTNPQKQHLLLLLLLLLLIDSTNHNNNTNGAIIVLSCFTSAYFLSFFERNRSSGRMVDQLTPS